MTICVCGAFYGAPERDRPLQPDEAVSLLQARNSPPPLRISGGQRVRSSLFGLLGCNAEAAQAVTMRAYGLEPRKRR